MKVQVSDEFCLFFFFLPQTECSSAVDSSLSAFHFIILAVRQKERSPSQFVSGKVRHVLKASEKADCRPSQNVMFSAVDGDLSYSDI